MSERTLRFRLGLFVLLALVLLGVMVVLFGSVNVGNWFRRINGYTITFADAPGVSAGTPVRRSGVRIGEVTKVQLEDETGEVKVQIAIDKRYTLRKNERPTLITSVIGNDATIDFMPQPAEPNKPPPDRSEVPPGSTLAGVRQATVGTLLSQASEVVPSTQEALNEIRKTIQSLDKRAAELTPMVEDTLREYRNLAKSANEAMPDIKKTAAELRKLITALNEGGVEAKEANAAAAEMRKLVAALNEADPEPKETSAAAKELNKLIRSLNEALPELRETNREVQKAVKGWNEAFPEVRQTNKELQQLIKQAGELTPDARTAIRDIGAAAQQYNRLGEDLDKFVRDNQVKVKRIIDNFDAALDRTLDLLSAENRRNVADTLRNVRNASDRFPEMSKNLDETLKETRETARRLRETLNRTDELITTLRDATKPLAERGPSIFRNLDESLDKVNKVLGDTRELMRVVGQSDGTLSRLLTDPSLYNRLDETARMVEKLVPRLDRMLKDFETFADKLARHPEAIGLGGVVKPGSGLKDPPAPYPGHVVPPR